MKKITLIIMAMTVTLLFTSQVFAQGPGNGPGAGREGGYYGQSGFAKLNLTDEQKTKIDKLISENQKTIRPLREKMFDKSVELRRMWLQANPDKGKITAAQKEVRVLRDQMQDKVTAMRFEIRKVLTPEQNEKLANMGWGRGPGFGPRGGGMRGHGGYDQGMGMCQ